MKKISIAIVLSLVMMLGIIGPASAITDGTPDGEGHPYVVLIIMDVAGSPAYRCSGTLISPTESLRLVTAPQITQMDNTPVCASSMNFLMFKMETIHIHTLEGQIVLKHPPGTHTPYLRPHHFFTTT